jgi:Ca2+-binding EF-hand superfamily protein
MFLKMLGVALALTVAAGQIVDAQRGRPMRYQGLDRNRDGRITRAEWNGSDQSFRNHDWNNDGVLSGDEVVPGARRQGRGVDRESEEPDDDYQFDNWTMAGFRGIDQNRDNRITADEWHFDRESFRRADHNFDGVISRSEFLNAPQEQDDDASQEERFLALDRDRDNLISRAEWRDSRANFDRLDENHDGLLTRGETYGNSAREDRFLDLDRNHDNLISRGEWRDSRADFDQLDSNRDGLLTRSEAFAAPAPPADRFTSLDVNRNGSITRDEWQTSLGSFGRLDKNRDGRLSREEFAGSVVGTTGVTRTQAFQSGHDRGLIEGRTAGREDRTLRNQWDLEGQRELEQADSGYEARMGARAEYQAGYREAFRIGYREGFGPR